ncbi:MAG TPA: heterodisulfide reductase subunit C [Anaerolineae bacterium]|nr:heterodisulfide reductase subunit C [Anaerolineae bacterium]
MTAPNRSNVGFLAEVMATPGGERVVTCYQCGTCSGSCPAVKAMDHTPRELIHLIQLGRDEAVLSSRTIWVCAACYVCAVRCPREIEITDLMASLRRLAVEKGVVPAKSTAFERTFLSIVKRDGRMFELEMLLRYKLLTNPLDLIGQTRVGLDMLRRHKLAFQPHRIDGRSELQGIFGRWEEGRKKP